MDQQEIYGAPEPVHGLTAENHCIKTHTHTIRINNLAKSATG